MKSIIGKIFKRKGLGYYVKVIDTITDYGALDVFIVYQRLTRNPVESESSKLCVKNFNTHFTDACYIRSKLWKTVNE